MKYKGWRIEPVWKACWLMYEAKGPNYDPETRRDYIIEGSLAECLAEIDEAINEKV